MIDTDVMSSGFRKTIPNSDEGNTTINSQGNVKNFKARKFGNGDKATGRNSISQG